MQTDDAAGAPAPRRRRADAVRNTEAVLEAAKAVFAEAGVDAPMRDIAARAGVGVGTIYRSYPQRSDLIIAVFRREVGAVAAEAERLGREHPPLEALRLWADRLARFVATKRGFSGALHSGDPAYQPLPAYFLGALAPRVQDILDAGAREGTIRADVRAEDLVPALIRLANSRSDEHGGSGLDMTGVLLDGLRAAHPEAGGADQARPPGPVGADPR
ncbi:TetR/AcrR family transcriptional regulator [Desertihabitans brevis]|uniref:TetR/AcrR family transcriptional regulator n=1 Tax=Desertihabitans brevis TaxID=2268447 RepID=A0A367YWC0_9ACTN|nr:TetR/AcrR family transcriptional regulator [Desertihabitans brevis]RCK70195.1 TetR/AcrR family transcriptional regulator [Desertihabitans brevis]